MAEPLTLLYHSRTVCALCRQTRPKQGEGLEELNRLLEFSAGCSRGERLALMQICDELRRLRHGDGYHRQSRVETMVHRVKLLAQNLSARKFDRRLAESKFRAIGGLWDAALYLLTKIARE